MEQTLQEAFELADDIIESVRQQPPPPRLMSTGEKSLHEKLYDIYVEECEKETEAGGLQSNVNLLEKLLRREALPCLVVNLYPGNQGYSLMLKDKSGSFSETFQLPYEVEKLLEYLDAEELPSFLIDVLEKSPVNVFHHGCVIAEIRDYRQFSDVQPPGELSAEPAVSSDVSSAASSAETSAVSSTTSPSAYQTRHILLRPTMQSLVSDVESITSDNPQWTEEEKLELESQLILATAEPLCLDPSVTVACTANRLLFSDQRLMTDSMRQCYTSHEWPFLELEEEQYICTTPPDVSTMVVCRKQAETKTGDQYDLKIAEAGKCVDTWKQRPCELEAPGEVDVHKYARGKQAMPCDDAESTAWLPPEVKYDYPLESEESSQPWEAKPSTSTAQSLSDPFFSPEVRPPTEGRCDNQMYLPHVAPSVHSQSSVAEERIEPGKAMGVGQGSVQSTAECLGKMLQGSTESSHLGQPSLGKKATSHSASSPALEMSVKSPAPLLTQPSTSGQGSSVVSPPSVSIRGRKLPRLAPSPRSAGLVQQTFWGVSSVNTLPSAAQSSASSTESNPGTQGPSRSTGQNVINLLGLAQRGPVLMSSPSQVLSFTTGAPASTETSSRGFLPPRSQMLSTQARAPQHSVQTSMKLIVKNTSGPVTVRLPPGSVILQPETQAQRQQPWLQPQQPQQQPWLQLHQPQQHPWLQLQEPQQQPWLQPHQPQQQPWLQPHQPQQHPWLQLHQPQQQPWLQLQEPQQQPWLQLQEPQQQQQPQPWQYLQPELQRQKQSKPLYVLIPRQHQPPRAPVPPQPVPPSYPQRSNIQQWALSAQQSGFFNLAEASGVRQPQTTVLYQLGSTQQSHGHNLPSQSFQYPAAQVEQLQARGQNVQLRFMPHRVAIPRAAIPQSHQGHTAGGQYSGTGRGGPPTAPES